MSGKNMYVFSVNSTNIDLTWSTNAISWVASGPVFCLLLRVCSVYAQPITGQVTDVTCPVIGRAQPELTLSKRQNTGPAHKGQVMNNFDFLLWADTTLLNTEDGLVKFKPMMSQLIKRYLSLNPLRAKFFRENINI